MLRPPPRSNRTDTRLPSTTLFLSITAHGNSGSTGPKGIEGEIAYFASFAALVAAADSAVKGKIVFIDNQMEPTQAGSAYCLYGPGLFMVPCVSFLTRSLSIFIRSIVTHNHLTPHSRFTIFSPLFSFPLSLSISYPHSFLPL